MMTQEELDEIFLVQRKDIMEPMNSSFYQFDLIEEDGWSHNSISRLRPESFEGIEFSHYWLGMKHFPIFKIKE